MNTLRKALCSLLLAGLLAVGVSLPVSAQVIQYPSRTTLPFINFSGGTSLTGGTSILTLAGGQLIVPVGSEALPSIVGLGATSTGILWTAAPSLRFIADGSLAAIVSGANFTVINTLFLGADADHPITRESSGVTQIGSDAAAPAAQTFKGPDGSGTDKAGGDMTFACGRGTGTALGGNCYIATAPAGAASNSTQNALVNRVAVTPTGVVGFSPQDVAATPVEPTTTLKLFSYNKSVADDGIVTLPAVTTNGWGTVVAGDASVRTQFVVDATGTVTLVNNTASVVANADTDANLDIGTAATQEPLQVKNRLGATRVLNIIFWYD